jgi:hypothetical protein
MNGLGLCVRGTDYKNRQQQPKITNLCIKH